MNQNEYPIDAREIPPKQKHPTIFRAWKELKNGEALMLINDHDPLPLYYQFACEHTGEFHWDYVEQGPDTWKVRITKGEFSHPGFVPQRKMAATAPLSPTDVTKEVVVDTRPIFARDETPCAVIEDAVANLLPGQTLVLLVPFEPVPLYTKLGKEGFSHKPRQMEDGSWRIEFKKGSPCGCSEIKPA